LRFAGTYLHGKSLETYSTNGRLYQSAFYLEEFAHCSEKKLKKLNAANLKMLEEKNKVPETKKPALAGF
tara:strand:- start:250 stop:456 length:207 start_codon:yes stop_codon:yes gene_type:complete